MPDYSELIHVVFGDQQMCAKIIENVSMPDQYLDSRLHLFELNGTKLI